MESLSEHPIGQAIAASYAENNKSIMQKCDEFKMLVGRGVSGKIGGRQILAGNLKLMEDNDIDVSDIPEINDFYSQGSTVIYVAAEKNFVGYIALSDMVRSESRKMLSKLTGLGLGTVLLTGDHKNAAAGIAGILRISEYKADCLPEDKLNYIDKCEKENNPVCMIGDGINDAPSLKRATVGIAMGGIGSDIAVDAADIVLVNDDLGELPHLVALSRRMMTTIKWNMIFSMGLNFIAIILAIAGILNPIVGALVHNAGSVLVIINSSVLLKWRE